MRFRLAAAVAACGLVLMGVWTAWRGRGLAPRSEAPSQQSSSPSTGVVDAQRTQRVVAANPTLIATAPLATQSPSSDHTLGDEVKRLLSGSDYRVPRAQVSRLSSSEEMELLRLYAEATEVRAKYKIVRILVFAHCTSATGVISNLLLTEFSAKPITYADEGILLHSLILLGIQAAWDARALEFLTRASTKGYWEQVALWTLPGERPPWIGALYSRTIQGLALSQQPAASSIIEAWAGDVDGVARLGIQGGICDAVFYGDAVREIGMDRFVDELMDDSRLRLNKLADWQENSPNGVSWMQWEAQVSQREVQLKTANR